MAFTVLTKKLLTDTQFGATKIPDLITHLSKHGAKNWIPDVRMRMTAPGIKAAFDWMWPQRPLVKLKSMTSKINHSNDSSHGFQKVRWVWSLEMHHFINSSESSTQHSSTASSNDLPNVIRSEVGRFADDNTRINSICNSSESKAERACLEQEHGDIQVLLRSGK